MCISFQGDLVVDKVRRTSKCGAVLPQGAEKRLRVLGVAALRDEPQVIETFLSHILLSCCFSNLNFIYFMELQRFYCQSAVSQACS